MEKTIIFCFTGTGNSLKVSRDIAASLPGSKIVSIREEHKQLDISGFTRVGFIFPVYFLGLPHQVEQFISDLCIPRDYQGCFFALATYANLPGNSLRDVDELLKKKQFHLTYGNGIKMGDNAVVYYKTHFNQEKLFQSYDKKMRQVCIELAAARKRPAKPPIRLIQLYHRLQIHLSAGRDVHFTVAKTCSGCGLCRQVCPADNICLEDSRPRFCRGCEQCMACIQLCPVKAIDYKGRCGQRKRYRHPDVAVKAIIALNDNAME